ncbi:MAG: AAA family ATPase [Prevotellaceae bacterium]|jgi:predicted ATPase|nr:AAA family ATPase [Prevotellaceae bacterium]
MAQANYIAQIEIDGLWGRYDVRWPLYPDVNILAGINGVGKTTILNLVIRYLESGAADRPKGVRVAFDQTDADTIAFDVIRNGQANSARLTELAEQVLPRTMSDTRNTFFDIVDELFHSTRKKIDRTDNAMAFDQYGIHLSAVQLSSGERQMLFILLTVLARNGEPSVLLMDEPEASLHIEWQQRLISLIRTLNPLQQVILSTHSPAVVMEGWLDAVTEVGDIVTETA